MKFHWLLILVHCLSVFIPVLAFEDYELDLYDLVEELKDTNFYEFMGLPQDASTAEVRKAYRKLSLVLHPDKNKDENAELVFRQLVAVSEILKSPEKREKYNYVLENGLPDWRSAIYYYRKVRKIGLAESSWLLLLIATVIHYACIWAAYWERRYNIEEAVEGSKKKETRKKKNQKVNDNLEDFKQKALESIKKPTLYHLLPCLLLYYSYQAVKSIPTFLYCLAIILKHKVLPPEPEVPSPEELLEDEAAMRKKRKPVVDPFGKISKPKLVEAAPTRLKAEQDGDADSEPEQAPLRKRKWEDSDYSRLSKAMVKFPQGTKDRWEMIGSHMGFSSKECLQRNRMAQSGTLLSGSLTQSTNYTGSNKIQEAAPQDGVISVRSPAESQSADWTNSEQKALESALSTIPKTVDDRWTKISQLVPGRTKAECIARFKYLSELVKLKKSS